MTSPQPAGARVLNGRHVLLGLVGFFAIIFAVNGVMIYKAESTFGGLDTDDAYRKGLAYNERVAAAAAQVRLGWRDEVAYVAATQRLRVALTDPSGQAVSALKVTAHVQRPTTTRFDQELVLQQSGPGTYETDAAALDAGWWIVDLTARRETGENDSPNLYKSRRRVWIKP